MKYAILIQETPEEFAKRNSEQAGAYWATWSAYIAALNEAGAMTGGNGLQPPSTATTVRVRNGKRLVQDGPFAETKELLGGFIVIEVPTLEQALDWAARCPAATTGSVEVRPVLPPMN